MEDNKNQVTYISNLHKLISSATKQAESHKKVVIEIASECAMLSRSWSPELYNSMRNNIDALRDIDGDELRMFAEIIALEENIDVIRVIKLIPALDYINTNIENMSYIIRDATLMINDISEYDSVAANVAEMPKYKAITIRIASMKRIIYNIHEKYNSVNTLFERFTRL